MVRVWGLGYIRLGVRVLELRLELVRVGVLKLELRFQFMYAFICIVMKDGGMCASECTSAPYRPCVIVPPLLPLSYGMNIYLCVFFLLNQCCVVV